MLWAGRCGQPIAAGWMNECDDTILLFCCHGDVMVVFVTLCVTLNMVEVFHRVCHEHTAAMTFLRINYMRIFISSDK